MPEPIPSIFDNLADALDNGYVGSRFGICCPDCQFDDNKSIHVLCYTDTFLQIYEGQLCAISGCCLNLYGTIEAYLKFTEAVGGTYPNTSVEVIGGNILAVTTGETACNNNDFYNCITSISGLCDDFSVFVESGIYEIGTLNGKSAICTLKDYIIDNSISTSDAQDLLSLFFNAFVGKGMVTLCNEDNIHISSVEVFLQYLEATGGFCYSPPPVPPA
jgi:hypothetical protein